MRDVLVDRGPAVRDPRQAAGGVGAGRLVAGYRLERPLGRGGMAQVWLGRSELNASLAAIKMLSPTVSEHVRELFMREHRAVLRLRHPNIVPVFDVGDDYLVTAYVEGIDLRRRMRSPISVGEALGDRASDRFGVSRGARCRVSALRCQAEQYSLGSQRKRLPHRLWGGSTPR